MLFLSVLLSGVLLAVLLKNSRSFSPRMKPEVPAYSGNYCVIILFFSHTSTFQLLDKPWSQLSSLLPPRFLPLIFIAHRVQQSHCSSIFHPVLLTHALALSASRFAHKKKFPRFLYTSMHSGGLELTKLTYTRFDDNLIRHRGDRYVALLLHVLPLLLVVPSWPSDCRGALSGNRHCSNGTTEGPLK